MTESRDKRSERFRSQGKDGRGRYLAAPAFLHYGFRPFFLLAAIHAALAIAFWLHAYATGAGMAGPFQGMEWHAHEMLFGFLGAVIAGFLLTAIPNWTGRLPLNGAPLAVLVLLWLAGRIGTTLVGNPALALVLDLIFPAVFLAAILREILAGSNWRNLPVAGMYSLFLIANVAHHLEASGMVSGPYAIRLALGAAAMLIALIGGRITPSFTRNWLVKQGATELPASFGALDRAALAATAVAVLAWVALPGLSAPFLLAAGALLLARLSRWRSRSTLREPILLVLHAGYAWLGAALLLIGLSGILPDAVPQSSAAHALAAGAIGTMTLAVMTRATLGHTGREIRADGWTLAIYLAVTLGALIRVAAPFAGGEARIGWLVTGGVLWGAAFALFALRYGPMLVTPRRRGDDPRRKP